MMNGEEIIDTNLDDWIRPYEDSDGSRNKFNTACKDMPRVGHIGLQDHRMPVCYRNVRIRPLGRPVSM